MDKHLKQSSKIAEAKTERTEGKNRVLQQIAGDFNVFLQ